MGAWLPAPAAVLAWGEWAYAVLALVAVALVGRAASRAVRGRGSDAAGPDSESRP